MTLDLAVAELLQLDPSQTRVSSFGHGSSSASMAKIAAKLSNCSEKLYFMKTLRGEDGPLLMKGNHLATIVYPMLTLCSFIKQANRRRSRPYIRLCRVFVRIPLGWGHYELPLPSPSSSLSIYSFPHIGILLSIPFSIPCQLDHACVYMSSIDISHPFVALVKALRLLMSHPGRD